VLEATTGFQHDSLYRGGTMQTFLNACDAINESVGKFLGWVLVIPCTLLIAIEVFLRYVVNRPTSWGMPIAQFIFGIISVLAGGYTLLHGEHVTMDIVYKRFSPKVRAAMDLFSALFFFLFAGAMLWKGFEFAWSSMMSNETYGQLWNPIIYPFKMMIPLGAFLILLQGIAKFIRDFGLLTKKEP
jgi:TRAP-type mannitol/chloroaromatic compound transport system permease small subunit